MLQLLFGILILAVGGILMWFGGQQANEGWEKMHLEDTNMTPVETESSIIGDDNIQATTTGDNSPIVVGDYVAGNQTVNSGPSLEDIKAAMREVSQEKAEYLHIKYASNYSVGAITGDGFVGLKGEVPSGIEVKWETGRVTYVSSERVQILMPDIIANTDHYKDMRIAGNTFNLPKKIGAKINLIKTKDFSVVIEVIGIDQDIVTVALALSPMG